MMRAKDRDLEAMELQVMDLEKEVETLYFVNESLTR